MRTVKKQKNCFMKITSTVVLIMIYTVMVLLYWSLVLMKIAVK